MTRRSTAEIFESSIEVARAMQEDCIIRSEKLAEEADYWEDRALNLETEYDRWKKDNEPT